MGEWKYKIVHDYDATKLIKEFRAENSNLKNSKGQYDDEIDFIVYAEKDDFTISMGRVLLIKMSDAMVKYYFQYKKKGQDKNKGQEDLVKYWSKFIYDQHKNNKTFHFTEDEIAKAFLESIKLQTKLISDISVLYIENFIKQITENISTFLHDKLKFTREQWDPTLKSDKYLFEKPENGVKYFVKKCDDLVKSLKDFKARLELLQSFKITKTEFVADLIKTIDDKIKSIQKFKAWLIENKDEVKLKIPYICGLWNGMVEFVAGMIDIVLLGLNIGIAEQLEEKTNLELREIRESIEEIISSILKDPLKVFNEAINAIKNYKYSRYNDPKLNKYELQYNEGEDIILAIDVIVTIVTIIKGIAKLTKQLPKFTKWIDDVLARNGKGALKVEEALQEAKRAKKLIGAIEYEILNPNLLKKYLDDLLKICKEKGVKLEIKWIDDTHPEFNSDLLGRLDVNLTKKNVLRLNLRPECPKITWFHEKKHFEDFLELGWRKYIDISKKTPWKHEQSVWDFVYKNRNKWSEPELIDAYLYVRNYTKKKSLNKIKFELKEMEDLGKKLGLID